MTQSPLAAAYVPGFPGHTQGLNGTIVRVVLHGTVSPCANGQARAVAAYFQSPSSGGLAHYVVDPGEVICCASEDLATWGAPPNHGELHVEMCDPQAGDPARWNDVPHQQMLKLTSMLTMEVCRRQRVPVQRLTVPEVAAGTRGICGHHEVSQAFHETDHTDPDSGGPFVWDQFMSLLGSGGHSVDFDFPPFTTDSPIVSWHMVSVMPAVAWVLCESGATYALPSDASPGAPRGTNGRSYFSGRVAAKFVDSTPDEKSKGIPIAIVATSGERYTLPG